MILIGIGANLPGRTARLRSRPAGWAAARSGCAAGTASAGAVALVSHRARPAVRPAALRQRGCAASVRAGGSVRPILLICSPRCRQSRRRPAGSAASAMRARTLDLDIIAMGEAGADGADAPDPVLPHPRAHLRAFVLVPLLDVAPGLGPPRPAAIRAAICCGICPSAGDRCRCDRRASHPHPRRAASRRTQR